MQQGGRPGGARFAQFKLVLLGGLRFHTGFLWHDMLTIPR
jgi:hypothetical protein